MQHGQKARRMHARERARVLRPFRHALRQRHQPDGAEERRSGKLEARLTLYAEQAGFLSAAEEGATESRFEVLGRAGLPIPLPDADHHLIGIMGDVGWCTIGGWGPSAITATEVMAWSQGMGESLTPWEFGMVRRMSAAFVAGSQADRAPYQPVIVRMALASAAFRMG